MKRVIRTSTLQGRPVNVRNVGDIHMVSSAKISKGLRFVKIAAVAHSDTIFGQRSPRLVYMEPQAPVRHVLHTEAERDAIRKQLERMLANPLFKNSKRYPNLLRYIVEHTLLGAASELKERNLGVQVFGRELDYDTNADPIVRATAGEIRKRIAQYYHEHGHEAEVRIDLLPGSYVPGFEILEPNTAGPTPPISIPASVTTGALPSPPFHRLAWAAA